MCVSERQRDSFILLFLFFPSPALSPVPFGPNPIDITCPRCRVNIRTGVTHKAGKKHTSLRFCYALVCKYTMCASNRNRQLTRTNRIYLEIFSLADVLSVLAFRTAVIPVKMCIIIVRTVAFSSTCSIHRSRKISTQLRLFHGRTQDSKNVYLLFMHENYILIANLLNVFASIRIREIE